MTEQEAKEKLLAIAAGRYCTMSHSIDLNNGYEERQVCRVYLDPGKNGIGHTWEDALNELYKLDILEEVKPTLECVTFSTSG